MSSIRLATGISAERIAATKNYALDMSRINNVIVTTNEIAKQVKQTDEDMKKETISTTSSSLDKAKNVSLLSGLKKSLETQKEDIFICLNAYIDGRDEQHSIKKKTISVGAKKDLEIPKISRMEAVNS